MISKNKDALSVSGALVARRLKCPYRSEFVFIRITTTHYKLDSRAQPLITATTPPEYSSLSSTAEANVYKKLSYREIARVGGRYAVQGHSPILVPIESPYTTSY